MFSEDCFSSTPFMDRVIPGISPTYLSTHFTAQFSNIAVNFATWNITIVTIRRSFCRAKSVPLVRKGSLPSCPWPRRCTPWCTAPADSGSAAALSARTTARRSDSCRTARRTDAPALWTAPGSRSSWPRNGAFLPGIVGSVVPARSSVSELEFYLHFAYVAAVHVVHHPRHLLLDALLLLFDHFCAQFRGKNRF